MRCLAAAAVVLATACNSLTQACTLIGCVSGLLIAFDAPPTVPYHLEVSSGRPASSAKYVFDCATPGQCASPLFPDYLPETAIITVTTAAGTKTVEQTPAYITRQPNGPSCGPTCRSATVTISLP